MKRILILVGFTLIMSFNAYSGTILPISEKSITNNTVFTVTAYCSCVKCCGKWAKYNKTANGLTPKQGITCAASRKIPFNTKLSIGNLGTRIVQDRLATKYDSRIDIYFTNHIEALKFGKQQLKVSIIR